jgi:uncharacterized metal-binding protein
MNDKTVLVIPCSGMGKVHGLIGREATYMAVEDLTSDRADTICLAMLVKGEPAAVTAVREHTCITLDGCPKECARKNVEMSGGEVAKAIRIVDAFRNHRGAQPGTATTLAEDGWVIAREIAENVEEEIHMIYKDKEDLQ